MELEAFIVEGADSIIESQRSPERTPNVFSVRRSRTGKEDGSLQIVEANETNKKKLKKRRKIPTKKLKQTNSKLTNNKLTNYEQITNNNQIIKHTNNLFANKGQSEYLKGWSALEYNTCAR